MFFRRALLFVLVAISGCAAFGDGYEWSLSDRGPLPAVWFSAGQEGVRAYCQPRDGFTIYACEIYEDVCLVVAEKAESELPRWLTEHAKKHCNGFDHRLPIQFPRIK